MQGMPMKPIDTIDRWQYFPTLVALEVETSLNISITLSLRYFMEAEYDLLLTPQ